MTGTAAIELGVVSSRSGVGFGVGLIFTALAEAADALALGPVLETVGKVGDLGTDVGNGGVDLGNVGVLVTPDPVKNERNDAESCSDNPGA